MVHQSFSEANLIDELYIYTSNENLNDAELDNPLIIDENWDIQDEISLDDDILKLQKKKKFMFTGIIEEIGQIILINDRKDFLELEIDSSFSNELVIGDSVAINGVCLTVVKVNKSSPFTVNVVEETLNRTSLKDIQLKTFVNLERAVLVSLD